MYSIDLREKIIEVYLEGNESLRNIAKRFRVSFSFVYDIWTKYKKTGNVTPKEYKGKEPKIIGENLEILKEMIANKKDILQKEIVEIYKEKVGIQVTQPTISRMLKKLKVTRKKKA
jgi:transposase